jgi:hypothetical protein
LKKICSGNNNNIIKNASAVLNNRSFHGYVAEPAHPIPGKKPKVISDPEEAVSVVQSGMLLTTMTFEILTRKMV